jgi:hypothetical protein
MRFDLPQGLELVHAMRIPVRWGASATLVV